MNDTSFYARHASRILLIAAVLLPFVGIGAIRAMRTNNNDVREWLPEDYEETQQYRWFRRHFGSEEFVVASWEGCTVDDPRLAEFAGLLMEGRGPDSTSGGPPIARFKRVVTGQSLVEDLTRPPLRLTKEEAIRRLQGSLIGADGQQTCAVITLTDLSRTQLRDTLEAIRATANSKILSTPIEGLRLGGPPVVNAAIDATSGKSLRQLVMLSGVVGLAIAWWCFRTWRVTAMAFATALYGAALSLAVVHLFGGKMNAILMTMAPLVYVAGMSGAIHLANYFGDAVRDFGLAGAPSRAVQRARLPLALATCTTAVGLVSLCYSELSPIQSFGVFSAIGVLLSLLLLFFVLPSMMQLWPPHRAANQRAAHRLHEKGEDILSPGWQRFANFVIGHPYACSGVCLAALAISGLGLLRVQTSIKILRFFSHEAPVLQDYRWLESHLVSLVPMEVVLRLDSTACERLDMLERLELVQRVQRRIAEMTDVDGTMSAATFAPDMPLRSDWPAPAGWSTRRSVLAGKLEDRRQRIAQAGYLREARQQGEELWRISLRVSAIREVDYGEFIARLKTEVEPVLAEQRAQGVSGINATYTGMVPVVYKAQHSLLDGLIFGFGTDLLLIVAAIVVLMRHWSPGVVLTLTSLFPTVLVFGTMGWSEIVIDIGTVMTPSVALGVTIDDVVHFLLWFRRGIERGLPRAQAVLLAYEGCARAMYQSWGVIGIGLSMFAFSSFTPTMRFGALMVALLTVGLAGNLIFLPALLAGPLGEVVARRIRFASQKELALRANQFAQPLPEPANTTEVFVRPERRSVRT